MPTQPLNGKSNVSAWYYTKHCSSKSFISEIARETFKRIQIALELFGTEWIVLPAKDDIPTKYIFMPKGLGISCGAPDDCPRVDELKMFIGTTTDEALQNFLNYIWDRCIDQEHNVVTGIMRPKSERKRFIVAGDDKGNMLLFRHGNNNKPIVIEANKLETAVRNQPQKHYTPAVPQQTLALA